MSTPLITVRGRAVPGIGLVIAGAAMVVAIASAATVVLRREEGLEERAAQADSVAREKTLEAVIARRTAAADSARADSLERQIRSDSAANATRAELRQLSNHAAASSAKIDRATLAPDVADALAAADTFRLAVTPALVEDSIDTAQWRQVAQARAVAYSELADAYAEQGAALLAREAEVRAVRAQHAPRCGWKCGGAIAVILVEGIRFGVQALAR